MEEDYPKKKKWEIPGVRYLFAFNGLFGFAVVYALRMNINVAIVAMVNQTAVFDDSKNNLSSEECLVPEPTSGFGNSTGNSVKDGEFIWSPKLQGVVLGAFFYGYCISQVPGGRLSEIFSGKWVFGISTLLTAFLTLLTPLAVHFGVGSLIAIRVLEGLALGATFPSMNFMIGRWVPESEKAVLNTLVYSGISVGTMVSMPLTGYLCNSDFLGGWPSSFYVFGSAGCLWFIVWSFLVTDTPLSHPLISEKELKYIMSDQRINLQKKLPPIPWRKIFTSVPFWAVAICKICQDWSFYTIMTDLPTYFSTILHLPIEEDGLFSAFPILLQTIVGLIVSAVCDFLIRKKMVRVGFIRKFCNSVSGFGAAIGYICVCFSGCNVNMNKFFFMYLCAIGGFGLCGYALALLDLSPEYIGTLEGILNSLANLSGFLTPLLVGFLTDEKNTLHQWRIVFIITSCLLTFSSFVFLFFSTSEKQNWADSDMTEPILDAPMENTAK